MCRKWVQGNLAFLILIISFSSVYYSILYSSINCFHPLVQSIWTAIRRKEKDVDTRQLFEYSINQASFACTQTTHIIHAYVKWIRRFERHRALPSLNMLYKALTCTMLYAPPTVTTLSPSYVWALSQLLNIYSIPIKSTYLPEHTYYNKEHIWLLYLLAIYRI